MSIKDHFKNAIYISLIVIFCIPFGLLTDESIGIFGVILGGLVIVAGRYILGWLLPWEIKKFISVNKKTEGDA